jgi:hypothetical protein
MLAGCCSRAVVHAASVQERAAAKLVLAGITAAFPLPGLVWADREHAGVELPIVARNADVKGFQLLARRWVVERTFAR